MARREQEHTPRVKEIWEYVQAICLDVITLIQQFVDNNVETCVGAKLQLHS